MNMNKKFQDDHRFANKAKTQTKSLFLIYSNIKDTSTLQKQNIILNPIGCLLPSFC